MRIALLAVVAVLWAAAGTARAQRPHVYLIVVDGLGADAVDATLMPRLFDRSLAPVAIRTAALAAMPARTNPNHVTLLTGVPAQAHGITGNGYVDRGTGIWAKLEDAALIEVETLFTIAERTRPALVTMAAFSKAKLGRLFAAVPNRQHAPDVLWVPSDSGVVGMLAGIASDAETMRGFLEAAAAREPDLAAINLSGVDRAAHEVGPGGIDQARRDASDAIGRLVDDLRAKGRWERSILIVTADHGFDDVSPRSGHTPLVVLSEAFTAAGVSGLFVAGEGGVGYVYAGGDPGAAQERLAWAAAVAWRTPGVTEVLARLPVAGVPLLCDVHPDWGLAHERAGDLVVVAAPGHHFVEPGDRSRDFRGNHGSPRERRVPLVIAGGALGAGVLRTDGSPTAADVGATIAALLDLPAPRRFDGAPVEPGRVIALPVQSPH